MSDRSPAAIRISRGKATSAGNARRRATPPPPRSPREHPPLGTLVSVGVVAAALVGLAFFSLLWGSGGGGRGGEVEVVIPPGASTFAVAELLETHGAARRRRLLGIYLTIFWGGDALQPGPHLLTDNLNPRQLALRLTRDPEREKVQVTIPEGWNRLQIARRLHEKQICTTRAFLEATADPTLLRELKIPAESAEGYLFPATYPLAIDSDPKQLVRQFKGEFDRRIARLRTLRPDGGPAQQLGWGLHQVVILASMVEREAAVDDERPLVASAFYNRFLDPTFTPKPPRLQSDATTAYGCQVLRDRIPSCANYQNRVTPEMNQDPANPYSTYTHAGLPPGPVANPGERSLQAALDPANTKYLYFVGKGGGRHTFSETLTEHNAAIKQLRELRSP
ncbi:MAG: endolytic transglycosylase MltG [Myxococcales bacterium]|nr:endolytic transglycosylase MltG [Polyangiaceae bacterium]MDW8250277.1 endolytic transglycosylase MltG [Myxococcales bacterium]